MTSTLDATTDPALDGARLWLAALDEAFASRDRSRFEGLFLEESFYRDLGALTWNFRQAAGRDNLIDLILGSIDGVNPRDFRVDENKPTVPALTQEEGGPRVIEVFLAFDVDAGTADGLAYLVEDATAPAGWRAVNLLTRIEGLRDHAPHWPRRDRFDDTHPDVRWSEHRDRESSFTDSDPDVLLVGGGQFGVMMAAHLNRLGVPNVVIDKHERVGDTWRKRYESLLLHQPHGMLYFPFLKFPDSYPEYIPKDKFANWFEAYVEALDINFWTSSEFEGGTYDETSGRWTVRIAQADGSVRELRPKHVVLTTGGSQKPRIPDIAGLPDFAGEVVHSSKFVDGKHYAGKNVLVVGTGTSGHDIALDIHKQGGISTILQRSPAIVLDIETANLSYAPYNPRDIPVELIDIRFMSGMVYPQLKQNFIAQTKIGDDIDKELHDRLRAAGMKIGSGPEDTGFFYSYFLTGGGYYLDVGASQRIIDGDIGIVQTDDVETFTATGVRLKNGEELPLDAVILATGYEPIETAIEEWFGAEVREKVGKVWGFGTDGEINNVWKPTPQDGLWIMLGAVAQARWYTPTTSLLIKAYIENLVPREFLAEGHPSRTPKEQIVEI
ncbi:flavin-containing monooxygenase [Nocardia asteroides]|uniref:flavin-containing monooxygenase n=1 Tax=Nocardia asteroides TaxID=1824 RepID=UPI001E3B8A05|nr:NAD(P)/FAD-dependent oxidoreductase [Nocardia asteroides]UGT61780.1 NAD(P)/FAD-dependent oxidoreductase [Nocardia asteroides]